MSWVSFFEGFFENFGKVIQFMNTPITITGKNMGINVNTGELVNMPDTVLGTPIQLLSISLGAFLFVALSLHIWHLIKLVF